MHIGHVRACVLTNNVFSIDIHKHNKQTEVLFASFEFFSLKLWIT